MYRASYIRYPLRFKTPAGTSRGVLTRKDSWFIRLSEAHKPQIYGIGECSLLPGLSLDDTNDFELNLAHICQQINTGEFRMDLQLPEMPSVQFGLETALKDLLSGGRRLLYPSFFTKGQTGIPLNGLIWMDDKRSMLEQIDTKMRAGFRVLKMKVGALKFQDELEILHILRTRYDQPDLEIRLDANGAWSPEESLEKLKRLSEYHIHSIEQPIKAGNHIEMARLCSSSPIEIALDEELIGIFERKEKERMLEEIRPAYLILKPGLIGGIAPAEEWIELADATDTGWWITSALESNIGLNAIAQWTATLDVTIPQGLGTGALFTNNIPSPLEIVGDQLWYMAGKNWDTSTIPY